MRERADANHIDAERAENGHPLERDAARGLDDRLAVHQANGLTNFVVVEVVEHDDVCPRSESLFELRTTLDFALDAARVRGELAGPLGLFDLGRATGRAFPSGLVELAVAIGVAAVVFPLFAVGYQWWYQPESFSLTLPPNLGSFLLAQLIVVALPEEAFFRGYLQTSLSDLETRRIRILGASLAPGSWLLQAALFAVIHFLVEPNPARLAVFFPGLLFGWMRARRGGIGAALALHATSNLYSEILARSWL